MSISSGTQRGHVTPICPDRVLGFNTRKIANYDGEQEQQMELKWKANIMSTGVDSTSLADMELEIGYCTAAPALT